MKVLSSDWVGDGNGVNRRTVPLTVARTANPFFADYQPQNASVFSMFDDLSFSYQHQNWQICDAKVSYTVVGYHSDMSTDPLYPPIDGQSGSDRMKACSLQSDPPDRYSDPSKANQVQTLGGLRSFCHGSMFDVKFSQLTDGEHLDLLRYPGDDIQIQFATSHPLSVGTNDMDALFGWLRAQDGDQSDLHKALMRLQSYVLDTNDDLDSQLQAEDLLATNNFISSSGETIWHFATPNKTSDGSATADSAPNVPSSNDVSRLRSLNNYQALLDVRVRERVSLKTQLFDLFWKCLADQGKSTSISLDTMKVMRTDLRNRLDKNLSDPGGSQTGQQDLQLLIGNLLKEFTNEQRPVQSIAGQKFYIQQDPTLFVSGMAPDWPKSFNDDLKCRCGDQVVTSPTYVQLELNRSFPTLDPSVHLVLLKVFNEAYWLRQNRVNKTDYPNYEPPLYYPDEDRFDGANGWFPLFIEWEVEYYHLPWEFWEFKPCGPESRYGYCIGDDVDLSQHLDVQLDYRILSGRTPLLPQAAASLEATLQQVYTKINPDDLNEMLDEQTRNDLLVDVRSLDYLSTPMVGFTDQLITRFQGTHFAPLRRGDGGQITIDPEAKSVASDRIGMTDQDFLDMDLAGTTTPFASLTDLPADPSKVSPFKPCTHGQFRFTKLNIMDKFGQVVNGIRTSFDLEGNTSQTPLFPCLGDSYSVQELSNQPGKANTILPREDGFNSFVQLPPSINQLARMNAQYVTQYSKGWRHIEEWENPVRGWLVIDYANTSIQIFSAKGIFVREYSVITGTVAARPFPANSDVSVDLDPLLLLLLKQFTVDDWLLRFFQNLTRTIDATQASPSHYAESMLSILGKPLALVTFGYSLEIAQPPLSNQSTIVNSSQAGHQSVTDYAFPIKLGDKDNVFDGLFGLFGGDWANFDFSIFQSYHDPDESKQPQLQYSKPFYIDPSQRPDYIDATDSYLNPLAAIVDPFTPVNIYTALLPIKQLAIPSWCLSSGLDRIASFFKTGPTLIANDVPDFDPTKEVKEDYCLNDPTMPATNGAIPIPAVGMADFKWLQPYQVEENGAGRGGTKYNTMDIEIPSEKPLWQTPPYVVTEGYLQMAKPFTAPSMAGPKEQAG